MKDVMEDLWMMVFHSLKITELFMNLNIPITPEMENVKNHLDLSKLLNSPMLPPEMLTN